MLLAYDYWLLAAILVMAILYSSVGHGGASGYLAAMALWGLAPETMRPAALLMNIVVTCWLLYRFKPYQLLPHKLFWPLVLGSAPMAFIGGMISVDATVYRLLVGGLLLFAALRMLMVNREAAVIEQPQLGIALLLGAVLGFASGLTGIGGGLSI